MRKSKAQRLRERRAKQFGSEGKREWIMGLPDAITGERGTRANPIDPAHIGRTRAAGAGPERMLPLARLHAHRDYDSMGRAQFAAKYGITHQELLALADEYERRWQEHLNGLAY